MSVNVTQIKAKLSREGNQLLTPKELAHLLKISTSTLERYRSKGGGPSFHKKGGRFYYPLKDVVSWLVDAGQKRKPKNPRLLISKFTGFLTGPPIILLEDGRPVRGKLTEAEISWLIASERAYWETQKQADSRIFCDSVIPPVKSNFDPLAWASGRPTDGLDQGVKLVLNKAGEFVRVPPDNGF